MSANKYRVTVKREDTHSVAGDSALVVANTFVRRRKFEPGTQTISVVRAEGYDQSDMVNIRVTEDMLLTKDAEG